MKLKAIGMQNNEFEKQVQERMGQIKFTPSEAVWAEVEKSLKQRRKRRIAIVWLFAFIIAAGGSSLAWFYFSPGNSVIANHETSSLKNDSSVIPSLNNNNDQSSTTSLNKNAGSETQDLKETSSSKNIADTETKQSSATVRTTLSASQKNIIPGSTKPNQKNNSLSPGSSFNVKDSGSGKASSKKKNSSAEVLAIASPIAANENSSKINTEGNESNKDIAVIENISTPDSAITQKDSAVNLVKTAKIDSAKASSSTVKINTKTKSKWLFGLTFGAGMSDIVNPVSGAKSMDALYASSPSSNLSSPGSSFTNSGLPGGAFIYPSELNPGISFLIGAEATKKINKRVSLNVGLQYHYYSSSIVVGSYNDSTKSYSAYGPRVNDHRNKYHFAELPVTFGFQLLNNKPLQLSAGLSVGYLFASDVLVYDKSQAIYYTDKDKLNKTQLNALLGLSWTFLQKSKTPIQVGPSMSYSASNVSGKSANGSNHMFNFGGSAKIMFRKK